MSDEITKVTVGFFEKQAVDCKDDTDDSADDNINDSCKEEIVLATPYRDIGRR